jgi:putative transposase
MWKDDRVTKCCKRYNDSGCAHELTFSCYQSRNFLSKERPCQWLAEAIDQARTLQDFSLWAYVFMPNHVHLLIRPHKKDYSVSAILKAIKTPVATKAIRYLKENNPEGLKQLATGQQYRPYHFWQKGGGYDRNMNRTDTLIEAVRYIHLNPVRKKLVDSPLKWYYSSASAWAGLDEGSLKIDKHEWPVWASNVQP